MTQDAAGQIFPAEAPGDTIPVFEETASIRTRLVETGRARVHVTVDEHEQLVEAMLMRQDLHIDRIPVDRQVAETPPMRRVGDTIVVPVMEERLVVETRLFLKEELHIRIDETRHAHTQTVTLRRETATIDGTNPDGTVPNDLPTQPRSTE